MPFALSIGALGLVQALLVALPRPGPTPSPLRRLGSRWWALALPGGIVVVIGGIALYSATARGLTYLALVAVPPLAALALALFVRGGRQKLALAAVPLFAAAWAWEASLAGHTAALALSALACVALGCLLVSVAPGSWVRLGIYAMAAIDAWLVGGQLLQGPNAVLNTAAPAAGLPRLQLAHFGSAAMGFGDLFIAATLGALLAGSRREQLLAAALTACFALAFDLLFFAVDELPSTVPVALALAATELLERRRRRYRARSRSYA
jgi:hypothetical protein